jgi:hypothetical protein
MMTTGHENRDASVRSIVWTLAGLAVGAALAFSLVYGIFRYMSDHPLTMAPPNPMAESEKQIPPAPRVDDHPAIELKDLHTYEDEFLGTYGWTDKQKGIVRIPIDHAMELELRKGFPTK